MRLLGATRTAVWSIGSTLLMYLMVSETCRFLSIVNTFCVNTFIHKTFLYRMLYLSICKKINYNLYKMLYEILFVGEEVY